MHPRDPRDLSQSSQSLDEVLSHFDGLYNSSSLPFCIRDQSRKVIYKNDAFSDLFHRLSKSFSGISFDSDEVELELSSIELEAFVMGPETALCRTFNFNGEFYQLRVEIRLIDGDLYAIWLINYFPDYQALFKVNTKVLNDSFDVDIFLSEMTTKKMITLCFSVLGFHLHTMSRCLGVSESAITNRLASVKKELRKYFPDYDEFRFFCLKNGVYIRMTSVVLKVLNVKSLLIK